LTGTNDQIIQCIDKCREDFNNLPIEEIAFPRGVSDVNKYKSYSDIYIKGTPGHTRGALLFNHYLKQKKLTNKYSLIQNGERIKFVYLKTPNVFRENVIAFIQEFPKEFGVEADYDLQFEKAFLNPVTSILDIIGWTAEKKITLDSFFS
jgi:hypothetical protein